MFQVMWMTSLREMKEKGYIPQTKYIKLLTLGGISLFKVILTNLGDIKKLSQTTTGPKKFKRLPKKYKLPEDFLRVDSRRRCM